MISRNQNYITLKSYARTAGILYLLIILLAGFSEGYIRSGIIVSGDAAATADNILASKFLFRFGFVSDLIAFICDAVVAILLYVLLKPVNKTLALIAAVLRLIAHPAIGSLNLINHISALQVLNNPDLLTAFGREQLQLVAQQFLSAHKTGYLIAGAFFGVHCLLLGYLLFKSELFPKILGIMIFIASIGYLTESFGTSLFPEYSGVFGMIVVIPAVIAELSLCLWLLIKGIKNTDQMIAV